MYVYHTIAQFCKAYYRQPFGNLPQTTKLNLAILQTEILDRLLHSSTVCVLLLFQLYHFEEMNKLAILAVVEATCFTFSFLVDHNAFRLGTECLLLYNIQPTADSTYTVTPFEMCLLRWSLVLCTFQNLYQPGTDDILCNSMHRPT